jgi:hypothetical protein
MRNPHEPTRHEYPKEDKSGTLFKIVFAVSLTLYISLILVQAVFKSMETLNEAREVEVEELELEAPDLVECPEGTFIVWDGESFYCDYDSRSELKMPDFGDLTEGGGDGD